MKPSFLMIGAQKSGTTSLGHLLAQHPDVFIPREETHFFALDELFEKRGWKWYESLFANVGGEASVGERSTSYAMHAHRPDAPKRIARALPDAKLIYMVRHPLARIESHYLHLRKTRRTAGDFAHTLRANPYMIDTSLYWKQINYYRDHYADERILVLFLEDFVTSPASVAARCFRFLGVSEDLPLLEANAPRNPSLGESFDRPLGAALRRVPGAETLANALPQRLRTRMRQMLTTSLHERPTWTRALRAEALQEVGPDAIRFSQFYRRDPDFWSLPLE